MSEELLTVGQVGDLYGIQGWKVRRLFERKLLPDVGRVGHSRVIRRRELPRIEKALRAAGYLK